MAGAPVILGPHGNCPDDSCRGVLLPTTYTCRSPKGGSCMVSHSAFYCVGCHQVYEKVTELRRVNRSIDTAVIDTRRDASSA